MHPVSVYAWPCQHCPPKSSWQLWHAAIYKTFLLPGRHHYKLQPSKWLQQSSHQAHHHHCQWHYQTHHLSKTIWRNLNSTIKKYPLISPVLNCTRSELPITCPLQDWQEICHHLRPATLTSKTSRFQYFSVYQTPTAPIKPRGPHILPGPNKVTPLQT